jgi:hypothetical protein
MLDEFDSIKKELLEYLSVQFDLVRLNIAENISRIFSKAASIAIAGYLLSFILLFISFAGGFYISAKMDSDVLGFLCVACFYFLVLLIFLIFRRQIIERPIIKAVIKLLFQDR